MYNRIMATVAFAFDTVWYYSYCQCQSDFKKKSNLALVSIEALEHVVCKKSRVRETLQR